MSATTTERGAEHGAERADLLVWWDGGPDYTFVCVGCYRELSAANGGSPVYPWAMEGPIAQALTHWEFAGGGCQWCGTAVTTAVEDAFACSLPGGAPCSA